MTLIAQEGMWLTQVKDVHISERVFATKVMTSTKKVANWHEITDAKKQEYDAEYAQWLAEQEQSSDSGIDDGTGI